MPNNIKDNDILWIDVDNNSVNEEVSWILKLNDI
jgi:hypothetical protein